MGRVKVEGSPASLEHKRTNERNGAHGLQNWALDYYQHRLLWCQSFQEECGRLLVSSN